MLQISSSSYILLRIQLKTRMASWDTRLPLRKNVARRVWHVDVHQRTKITMCVFRDLETGITWRENFLRIPIARRLWAAYEIKPNLENAMTFGIEFLVFLSFAEL